MTIEITAYGDPFRVNIIDTNVALSLTAEAIRDIAHAIRNEAIEEAPMGETGQLKAHPVDIRHLQRYHSGYAGQWGTYDLGPGELVEDFPSFGGGLTARGGNPKNRGQFSRGGITSHAPGTRYIPHIAGVSGHTIEEIEITVAREPKHAVWVHEGTGIFGPIGLPIIPVRADYLKWTRHGVTHRRAWVAGQMPNPYLERAYVTINRDYVPLKMIALQESIRLYT